MKYELVGCGGTFGLLHKGHRKFLDFVLDQGESAIIGITSDTYLKKFKSGIDVAPFGIRKKEVRVYLGSKGVLGRVEIIPLDDPYGPAIDEKTGIEAIIVTEDTLRGAEKINEVRLEKKISALPVEVCDLAKAEDGGIISSTRIRNGEINREGRLYIKPEWVDKNFRLPEDLRPELQKPFGVVVKDVNERLDRLNSTEEGFWSSQNDDSREGERIITVGDVVSQVGNKSGLNQKISVVDFLVERQKKFDNLSELGFESKVEVYAVDNPAGTVSGELIKTVQDIFKQFDENKRFVIQVNGEEDLAVLPILLAAPLGWIIYYGQPHKLRLRGEPHGGAVRVEVLEHTKEKAYDLFCKFEET